MIIASIDIGTNTVLLLVAEAAPVTGNIIPIANLYHLPRIGKGLKPGQPILPDKVESLMNILSEYKAVAEGYKCDKIIATATNAFRIASNSDEIISIIRNKLDIEVDVISGEDEALFSFWGAAGGHLNTSKTIVIDIGGGSTEIVYGYEDKIKYKKSFHVGAVAATELYFQHAPPTQSEIENFERNMNLIFEDLKLENFNIEKAVAIAGTPTTLACIKMNLNSFNEELIEGSQLNYDELKSLVSELELLTPQEIIFKFKEVVKGREDILLSGSYILLSICKILGLDKVIVSTKGIRYGAIINFINNTC